MLKAVTTSNEPGMVLAADPNPWIDVNRDWEAFKPAGSKEEIKLGNVRIVIFVEAPVFHHPEPTHILPIAHRDEEITIRMLVEGMFVLVEHGFNIDANWRHPLRRIFVELEGDAYKTTQLGF